MELKQVRKNWNALARSNPLWSNLTGDRAWDARNFFATGESEIEAVMETAEQLEIAPRRRERALDFGCGVGRLTQAIGRRFDRADGVDIAKDMLHEARRHDRSGGRCHYHLDTSGHLGRFEDGSFDFVYSVLVLQHMEPADALRYIAELVRVLAPAGLLVFQVPRRVPGRPEQAIALPPGASRTSRAKSLPDEAFRARITLPEPTLQVGPGENVRIEAQVENTGSTTWPYRGASDERYKIQLGGVWIEPASGRRWTDEGRGGLPFDLAPGTATSVSLVMRAPGRPGMYRIELDMVQECVCWFGEMGSTRAYVPCRVEGDEAPEAPGPSPDVLIEPAAPVTTDSLRRRLGATILGKAYRALRRHRSWHRSQRARGMIRHPRMEMHSVPEEDVRHEIERAGGRLVTIDHPADEDGVESSRYWATR